MNSVENKIDKKEVPTTNSSFLKFPNMGASSLILLFILFLAVFLTFVIGEPSLAGLPLGFLLFSLGIVVIVFFVISFIRNTNRKHNEETKKLRQEEEEFFARIAKQKQDKLDETIGTTKESIATMQLDYSAQEEILSDFHCHR